MNDHQLADHLQSGLQELGVDLDDTVTGRCLEFLSLLEKWNKAYNLTAVNDPVAMISSHVLDSLSVQPFVAGQSCLDVGSGAGLPGIILALANPQQQWYLLDSRGKKTRFMQQAVIELKLTNTQIVHSRIEDYIPPQQFSTILSRAFASLAGYLGSIAHLLHPAVNILAMKGSLADEELDELAGLDVRYRIEGLHVPGIDRPRNLVIIDPRQAVAC